MLSGEGGLTQHRYRWDFSHVQFCREPSARAIAMLAWRESPCAGHTCRNLPVPASACLPGALPDAIRFIDQLIRFRPGLSCSPLSLLLDIYPFFTRSKLLTGTRRLIDL